MLKYLYFGNISCSPEGNNFRTILDKAVQADGQVKERYHSHRDTIALLCKPEPELNAAIPSANPAKTMQGSEVRELHADMEWKGGGAFAYEDDICTIVMNCQFKSTNVN